jgi:hypothetical protein
MKFFAALIVALGLTSCTQGTVGHMYAGIGVAYVNGKAADSTLLGMEFTQAKCEEHIKEAAAIPIPHTDGVRYVLGCAEFTPLVSVD